MRIYTAHIHPTRPPVLLREGFAWGALVFGPLWLLARGVWIAGILSLCAWIVLAVAAPLALIALHWALGIFGQDLRRWARARAGYVVAHVVAAPDEDAALARLLDRRPDLIDEALA